MGACTITTPTTRLTALDNELMGPPAPILRAMTLLAALAT